MQELDMPTNIKALVSKLPFKLREQWRGRAHDILEVTNDRAHLWDMVAFLEKHVKVLSDPIFGDLGFVSQSTVGSKHPNNLKPQSKYKMRGSSFATTVTSMEAVDEKPVTNILKKKKSLCCLYCSRAHLLEKCQSFKNKKHREKIRFLKEKGVCFGCLCSGHISRECDHRLHCEVCDQQHLTLLHIQRRNGQSEQINESSGTKPPTPPQLCGRTGAGKDQCMLSIVPVQVKSTKGNEIIKTYTFLDPGSTATFCSEHLMQTLKMTGTKTHFLLKTMGQERVVPSNSLVGMEVSGLEVNDFHPLPEVLTQKQMPATTDNIATTADLERWPYLSKVRIHRINADVDLLIGTNAPKLLGPWEIVNSCGDGPYAVRTVLGWVINGPLGGDGSSSNSKLPSAIVNRISVTTLEHMLNSQYNHDFNEKTSVDREMSREDMRFMEIMESSATVQDERYCLKLPFKKPDVQLPNNFAVAKQRLLALKRTFLKNPQLYKEYSSYINGVIEKGYAEPVPQEHLQGRSGKVWYIPHHSGYHPRKGSIRVMFDSGATCQGTSLNNELLQRPNLTSSLLGVLTRFRQHPVAFMGDIQAMFYQVKAPEQDRDALRFLWWPDGDFSKELREYRMTLHLFGAV